MNIPSDKITWKSLSECLAEIKAQAPLSESAEPDFCACGELRFTDRDTMQQGVTYCDGMHQYGLSTNNRSYKELDGNVVTYQPPTPVFGWKGFCPVYKKHQGWIDPYEGMTFKNFNRDNDPHNAYEKAFNFLSPGRLILGGPRGRGKTHLARALYRIMNGRQQPALWYKAPELAEKWRQYAGNYDSDIQAEARAYRESVRGVEAVFIDDLGEERIPLGNDGKPKTDLFNEQFKMLIEDCKALVITTNLDSKMLYDRYGAKIIDRMMAGAITASLAGENYRAKSFPKLKAGI